MTSPSEMPMVTLSPANARRSTSRRKSTSSTVPLKRSILRSFRPPRKAFLALLRLLLLLLTLTLLPLKSERIELSLYET